MRTGTRAQALWLWLRLDGREATTWAWDDGLAAEKGQPVAELAVRRRIWFCRVVGLVLVAAALWASPLSSKATDVVAIAVFAICSRCP